MRELRPLLHLDCITVTGETLRQRLDAEPGYVDRNGVHMPVVGDLPLGCAAVCNTSVSVQRLAVEAAVRGDAELLKQAMMLDPLTGAVCNPPEIWQMADEMLIAGAPWLPQYNEAIAEAKERPMLIPTKSYAGAARLETKSIEQMESRAEAQRKLAGQSDKAK